MQKYYFKKYEVFDEKCYFSMDDSWNLLFFVIIIPN